MGNPLSDKPTSEEVSLHYIDKIHAVLLETGKRINGAILSLLICSLTLVAVSVDAIVVDRRVAIDGFQIDISPSLLLVGGSWIVGILLLYLLGLVNHEARLRFRIQKLYRSLQYEEPSMYSPTVNPLEAPNVVTVVLNLALPSRIIFDPAWWQSREYPRFSRSHRLYRAFISFTELLISLIIILLPYAAQILAGYKLLVLFGWQWWILSSHSLLLLITLGYSALWWRNALPSPRAF